jgi:hypothetical protein
MRHPITDTHPQRHRTALAANDGLVTAIYDAGWCASPTIARQTFRTTRDTNRRIADFISDVVLCSEAGMLTAFTREGWHGTCDVAVHAARTLAARPV